MRHFPAINTKQCKGFEPAGRSFCGAWGLLRKNFVRNRTLGGLPPVMLMGCEVTMFGCGFRPSCTVDCGCRAHTTYREETWRGTQSQGPPLVGRIVPVLK